MNQDQMYQAFLQGKLDHTQPAYGKAWLVLALAFGLIFMVLGQQLLGDFWYEDDTNIFFYIQRHTSPWHYFFDIETMRALSPARTLTPMQPLSFLIDATIAGARPWFFYAHVVVVALATQALIWILIRKICNPWIATTISLCWIMNPATMAVTEFISARHYLEGLTFVGLACLAALKVTESDKWQAQMRWTALAVLAYLLGAACKELSVTNGFWLIFGILIWHRRWLPAAISVLGPLLYFAYRNWSIGLVGQGFDKDWSIIWDYPAFLAKLPFMLTGSQSGLLVFGFGAILLLTCLVRRRFSWVHCLVWSSHLAIALITILPVSIHWMASAENHGTWYRVGFFLNTYWLVLLGWLIHRSLKKPLQVVALPLLLLCFIWGSWPATRAWDTRKAPIEPLAHFYQQQTDRLLYTELPSIFFLGWHNLHFYGEPQRFVTRQMDPVRAERILANYKTVWRMQGNNFVQDQDLYNRLFYNATHQRIPLDGSLPKAVEADDAPVFARHEASFEDHRLVIYRKRGSQILSQHVLPPESATAGTTLWAWPRAFVKQISLGLHAEQATRVTLIWPDNSRQIVELDGKQSLQFSHVVQDSFARPLVAQIQADMPLRLWSFALTQQDMILQGIAIKSAATPAIFPHFPKSNGGWESRIAMINLNASETNVAVTWYDDQGQPLRQTYNLAPGSSFLPAPNQHPPVSAVVAPTPGITSFQTWQIFDERQSFVYHPLTQASVGADHLVSIPNSGKATPSLAFWNPNAEPLELELLDQNGKLLIEKTIAPYRKWAYVPMATQIPVYARSNAQVAGLGLWRTPWQQWTMAACVPVPDSLKLDWRESE